MHHRSARYCALLVGLSLTAATVSLAQPVATDSPFQIRYAANLNLGDSVVNITNSGASAGNICADVYVFDPNEEMVACCACLVSPNALTSYSVKNDLIANTLTRAAPTSVVIKLLSTQPVGGRCDPGATPTLAPGMLAWGTTLHNTSAASTPAGGFAWRFGTFPLQQPAVALTETAFSPGTLSVGEFATLTGQCNAIETTGGGFGICHACRIGGL